MKNIRLTSNMNVSLLKKIKLTLTYKKLFTQILHYIYNIYLINDFLFIFILATIIYISINVQSYKSINI